MDTTMEIKTETSNSILTSEVLKSCSIFTEYSEEILDLYNKYTYGKEVMLKTK